MIFTDKTRFAMNFAERLYLGKKDKAGNDVDKLIYNRKDFDNSLQSNFNLF